MSTIRITCFLCLFCPWLLSTLGCQGTPSEEAASVQTAPVVPVEISTVREGDIAVTIDALGQTEALRKETALSPAAGTIAALHVLEGSSVSPGDTLAVIQSKESQATLAGAQALLAAASTPEQKKEAQRALDLARSSQSLISIVSTWSGIVSSCSVVQGSQVAEGGELLTMIDPESIDFVAQVALKDLASVSLGQGVHITFTSVGGETFHAVVSAISPGSDRETQTVRVRLSFVQVTPQQQVFMKDGVTGKARIVAGSRAHVLLVPVRALLRNDDNDTYTIVTITQDSLSHSVPVVVGEVNDSTAEVSGAELHPGMSVVVAGHYALADSTHVTISARNEK